MPGKALNLLKQLKMSYKLYLEHFLMVKICSLTFAKLQSLSFASILSLLVILQSRTLNTLVNTFLNTENISAVIRYLSNLQTMRKWANIVSSFNINKASGSFSIPNKTLILLKRDISKQLAYLFYLSFSSGSFQSIPKTIKAVPVFRKDSTLDLAIIISLLSNVEINTWKNYIWKGL